MVEVCIENSTEKQVNLLNVIYLKTTKVVIEIKVEIDFIKILDAIEEIQVVGRRSAKNLVDIAKTEGYGIIVVQNWTEIWIDDKTVVGNDNFIKDKIDEIKLTENELVKILDKVNIINLVYRCIVIAVETFLNAVNFVVDAIDVENIDKEVDPNVSFVHHWNVDVIVQHRIEKVVGIIVELFNENVLRKIVEDNGILKEEVMVENDLINLVQKTFLEDDT